jgi:hypothetical protein
MLCSSRLHRALPPSGPPDGVRWCFLERSASGLPPWRPHRRRACARGGAGGLAFFLLLFRGAQPQRGWCSSTIARLQGFSSCSPAAVPRQWSSRRMTTSLVVERSKPGCGLPPALSFKDVHHLRWGGGRAESGLRLSRGLAAHFFLQHSGEKGVHQPCEGGELRLRGAGRLRRRQLPRVWLLGLGGFGAASGAASYRLDGAWLSVHRTGDGHAVRGSATSMASPAPQAVLGGRTRRRTPRGWRRCSWMVLSSLHGRTGARTSSRAPRQPPSTGAEVAAVIGAEVVAAAGEAAPCRGGCLRCRDHQRHLLLSPRLFGFNGLAVTPPPRRRMGVRTYSQ